MLHAQFFSKERRARELWKTGVQCRIASKQRNTAQASAYGVAVLLTSLVQPEPLRTPRSIKEGMPDDKGSAFHPNLRILQTMVSAQAHGCGAAVSSCRGRPQRQRHFAGVDLRQPAAEGGICHIVWSSVW